MIRFLDGPAEGQTLLLKRAPDLLRAVLKPDGRWDALDQLHDTPASNERIVVYRRHGAAHSVHVNMGRNGSGFYALAEYHVVDPQPSDDEVRATVAWRAWARRHAEVPA
jgi:hypothetical protein